MKKLLTFLILLIVGATLFAAPTMSGNGVIGAVTVTGNVPQQADILAIASDVSPDIVPADSLCSITTSDSVFAASHYFFNNTTEITQNKPEVKPYPGCSPAGVRRINDFLTGNSPRRL